MADENLNGHPSPPDSTAKSELNLDVESIITQSNSNSNSAVADGLSALISSVITGFDSTAESTTRSQEQLGISLDRLTEELDKLLEDAPSPFIMQHATRLSGVRKRVMSLNSVLKSIQRRIDNMDRMLSTGIVNEKSVTENSAQTILANRNL